MWLALGGTLALAVVIAAAVTYLGLHYLHFREFKPEPELSAATLYDLLKIAFAVAAGIGGVVALVTAYRRQRIAEFAERREGTRLFNERFATAAGQLGDENPAVRLAGTYAMAGLADDWPERRQTCVDVLCAYLRMPYGSEPAIDAPESERQAFRAAKEVRHTVLRVIAAHLQPDSRRATTSQDWRGLNLDFTEAIIDGADFSGAEFTSGTVNFYRARFIDGDINFSNAQFAGANIYFFGAEFTGGTVNFNHADFTGGTVRFDGAEFVGGTVSFRAADFTGGTVHFASAQFSGGTVNFGSAHFTSGTVNFNDAGFTGGSVNFSAAQFSGGTVNFGATCFSGGSVNFSGAEFSGADVAFTGAEFSGGTVSFSTTRFSGGTVGFRTAEFSSGSIRFGSAEFVGATVSFSGAEFSGSAVGFGGADWSVPPSLPDWDDPPTGVVLPDHP